MGIRVELHISSQEHVSLNVNQLNSLVINTGIAETLDNAQGFTGTDYFRMVGSVLKIANQSDGYFENRYEFYTHYHGSFEEEADAISQCLESGRIVFKLDIEGNPDKYFIITPNNVECREERDLV